MRFRQWARRDDDQCGEQELQRGEDDDDNDGPPTAGLDVRGEEEVGDAGADVKEGEADEIGDDGDETGVGEGADRRDEGKGGKDEAGDAGDGRWWRRCRASGGEQLRGHGHAKAPFDVIGADAGVPERSASDESVAGRRVGWGARETAGQQRQASDGQRVSRTLSHRCDAMRR